MHKRYGTFGNKEVFTCKYLGWGTAHQTKSNRTASHETASLVRHPLHITPVPPAAEKSVRSLKCPARDASRLSTGSGCSVALSVAQDHIRTARPTFFILPAHIMYKFTPRAALSDYRTVTPWVVHGPGTRRRAPRDSARARGRAGAVVRRRIAIGPCIGLSALRSPRAPPREIQYDTHIVCVPHSVFLCRNGASLGPRITQLFRVS